MEKAELVFIPLPAAGHLISLVELAKLLLNHDQRLSITVLILKSNRFNFDALSHCGPSISQRIKFMNLPETPTDDIKDPAELITKLITTHIPSVKQFVDEFVSSESAPDSPRLGCFVVDMFCTAMKVVADEYHVPTYVFYPSGASYLGTDLYIQNMLDNHNFDPAEFKNSDSELNAPYCVNPIPFKVLPEAWLKKEYVEFCLSIPRGVRQAKGILVNSFFELESLAVRSLQSDDQIPPVYPVGPILNLGGGGHVSGSSSSSSEIMHWLGNQPARSVVFLCFGSMGSLPQDQVMEFASALENSGARFLWSLRMPQIQSSGIRGAPAEVSNFGDILPAGFLDRTAQTGRVIGWAPQVQVLSNKAIGGFVSHCGWNSTLESIHFGVPMATLPLYAEQQFNAFMLVKEFGLAVEIKMDYRRGFEFENEEIVSAEVIEKAIRSMIKDDSEINEKVNEISEKSKKALVHGGSSYLFLSRFVDDVLNHSPSLG